MRVVVVAEFYPRRHDPVLGVWAHRQALAARDAGADVRVLVLHRPIAPAGRFRDPAAWRALLTQPPRARLDGLEVRYVPFVSPPRGRSYQHWGAYAAAPLAVALRALRRRFPFDLVHAHYAVPAADAVLRAGVRTPLVISEHGGDVFHTAHLPGGAAVVRRAFAAARLVLANSSGIERAVRELGAGDARVVELGADVDSGPPPQPPDDPTLVTVGHLVGRKRHADVLRAMWILRERQPRLRYRIIGDGPERGPLARLAEQLGLADRVELIGALPHAEALRRARAATIFAMPSVDEAFGVAYVEAMAAGLPAIGGRGEHGPEHLASQTLAMRLVPPAEPDLLAREIEELLEPRWRARVSRDGTRVATERYRWERCGEQTVAAYEEALRRP